MIIFLIHNCWCTLPETIVMVTASLGYNVAGSRSVLRGKCKQTSHITPMLPLVNSSMGFLPKNHVPA